LIPPATNTQCPQFRPEITPIFWHCDIRVAPSRSTTFVVSRTFAYAIQFSNFSLGSRRSEMHAMHATAIALSAALSTVAFAGDASVRAFHASPNAPAVDVLVNNALSPITGLSYGNVSSYVDVPGATYNFKIVPAGAIAPVVFDGDLALAADTDYTIAATGLLGGSPAFAPIVLIDDNTLNPAAARIRFVHASANAPAVDIAIAGGGVLFPNVSFGGNGGYISVPGGTYDLEVRLAGTTDVVLPLPGISVTNNQVYTAWAIGLVGDNVTPLGAAITVDAIPAPGFAGLFAAAGLVALRRRR
jgi:hypothetical protein